MRGFQLWINLPAREKMKKPAYRDIQPDEIPVVALAGGGRVKVIAGALAVDGGSSPGPIQGLTTDPLYFDIELPAGATFSHPVKADHNAFVYPYEGAVSVAGQTIPSRQAGVLGEGSAVQIEAGPDGARMILVAGKPLGEPVVQYGPFVMNSREQIEQALADYPDGTLTG